MIRTKILSSYMFECDEQIDDKINRFLKKLNDDDRFDHLITIQYSTTALGSYTIDKALVVWAEKE